MVTYPIPSDQLTAMLGNEGGQVSSSRVLPLHVQGKSRLKSVPSTDTACCAHLACLPSQIGSRAQAFSTHASPFPLSACGSLWRYFPRASCDDLCAEADCTIQSQPTSRVSVPSILLLSFWSGNLHICAVCRSGSWAGRCLPPSQHSIHHPLTRPLPALLHPRQQPSPRALQSCSQCPCTEEGEA